MAPPPEKYLYSLTMSFTMFHKKKKKKFQNFQIPFFRNSAETYIYTSLGSRDLSLRTYMYVSGSERVNCL